MGSPTTQQAQIFHFIPKKSILAYCNERVVRSLMQKAGLDHDSAQILFEDMLKFLAIAEGPDKLAPSAKIDLAWHEFILHTRDYNDFCQKHFGHFVHHEPMSWAECQRAKLDVAATAEFAKSVFGELSDNWDNSTFGMTCGSNGC